MMKRVVALLLFASISLPVSAHAFIEIEGRYWFTGVDATFKSTEKGLIGTEINPADDLGVGTSENFWEGRITIEMGNHKLRYSYTPFSWTGQKAVGGLIRFSGQEYTPSAMVDSCMEIRYHRFGYEYDFLDALGNRFGVIFDLKYPEADAKLKSDALGLDETAAARITLPTVGAVARISLTPIFTAGGEISGIATGSRGYLIDGEITADYMLIGAVSLSAGYRFMRMKFEEGDDKLLMDLKGPFLIIRGNF